ncbi:MAG: Flp pilus assembly complex ATPase component TadA [Chthoniobacterales bacterium]|nr:Flp pilus assembly complex ATPase component TadA [Chthoniobacterales bacterium]
MRQTPKVILLGEICDRETMEIALSASETGHLVLSALHTINAGQSINRILGLFTNDEEKQIRERLADTLRYVVSQRLVNKIDGSRLLVTEIMGSSLRTRETLLYGEGENRSFQGNHRGRQHPRLAQLRPVAHARFRRPTHHRRKRPPLLHAQKQNAPRHRDGEENARRHPGRALWVCGWPTFRGLRIPIICGRNSASPNSK